MKLFIQEGEAARPLEHMNGAQTRQAGVVMDRIAGLIPHEGVDYDVEITFSSSDKASVGVRIVAHTKKGEFWRDYVAHMMKEQRRCCGVNGCTGGSK